MVHLSVKGVENVESTCDQQITFLGNTTKGQHMGMLDGQRDEELMPNVFCVGVEGHARAEIVATNPGWQDFDVAFKKQKSDRSRKKRYQCCRTNGHAQKPDAYRWNMIEVNGKLVKMSG
ncbi:MAG: hypothetical protein Q9183_005818 [Haloplaca sp. 2 TL-2023]